jgi:HK97 family phage prohead protease
MKRFYGEFAKVNKTERTVSGYASTDAVDEAGEVILKSAIEEALADYMKFANIREMHEASAVGVAVEANMDAKGLYIVAKVVDRDAWEKVEHGVYKGFSIGGKVIKRSDSDRKIIEKLRLCEISLVDRPCNPDAVFDFWKAADIGEDMTEESIDTAEKRDFSASERKDDAKSGAAMKDGSFPIENGKDLENAIHLAGHAKDPAAARAHIKRRAAALGLSSKIPDSWKASDAEQIGGEDKIEQVEKADVAPAAVLATDNNDASTDGPDMNDEKHTPEMDPAKDPAVKVDTVETTEDPVAKADALLSAIEASEAPVVAVEEVQKSADEMMTELNDMISGLNAKLDAFDAIIAQNAVEKAALEQQIEDLTKAASSKDEALSGKDESIVKLSERTTFAIETLTKRLDESAAKFADLEKRMAENHAEAMQMPAPAKTLGPGAFHVVEKGADAAGTNAVDRQAELSDEEVNKALANMTDQDRAMALIKATHKFPRQLAVR